LEKHMEVMQVEIEVNSMQCFLTQRCREIIK